MAIRCAYMQYASMLIDEDRMLKRLYNSYIVTCYNDLITPFLMKDEYFDYCADVWRYGCTILKMLTGIGLGVNKDSLTMYVGRLQ
ncbi:unnamed protein product [Arabis nemorensis]|uniref:Protein kinase domain-containing protein n=1 Tax=Arabis nemorensis TaxID=586526 RepID=A0A565BSP0_9BRAS|nr:unnamed protein product [Arabis nemorensis]